jgi:hypothetical protein
MDDSGWPEIHTMDYQGSGFNPHLLDMPGHRMVQSIVNVYSQVEAQPLKQRSGLPLPKERPREVPDSKSQTDRTRLLGMDLSSGAGEGTLEFTSTDYAYMSFAGRPGGGVSSSGSMPAGELPADGKALRLGAIASTVPLGIELPSSIRSGQGDLAVYHAITGDLIVVAIKHKDGSIDIPSGTLLHVYLKDSKAWSDVPIPGDSPIVRSFGRWVAAVIAEDNASTPERESPGKGNRIQKFTRTGDPADLRFALVGRFFPGQLFLYNADTRERYQIDTGEGDSEVLLVAGGYVYYRVNNAVYRGQFSAGKVVAVAMLSTNEVIRDVHWAFLGL